MVELFFLLMMSHAVCDYALQNDYIAQAKNRHTKLGAGVWQIVLSAHGLIHSAGVYLVTMNIWAALFQFVTHVIIDFTKCENKISYKADQLLHLSVMVVIAIFCV